MPLPTTARIVVVGAGPTGLAAAISLVVNGTEPKDLVIVDGALEGENTSRAIAIHAATLEALDTIGCADKLIRAGMPLKSMLVRSRSAPFLTNDFSSLERYTKFSFFLCLSQTATEQILRDRLTELGVEVMRPYRVIGMTPSNEADGMDVIFESGEVIKAAYVIGADGARSVIRQISGIGFADPDGLPAYKSVHDSVTQIVLADVTFSAPVSDEFRGMTISSSGMFLLIPLGTDSTSSTLYGTTQPVYRIGINVPLTEGPPPHNPPLEFLQECLNKQGPFSLSSDPSTNPSPIQISKVHWSTRFRTHSAIADTFFKRIPGEGENAGGIVMLVGDAAHIHSPLGGQGMNLGLRDAISLAPVLTKHMRSNDGIDSGLDLLREFASSRRESALNVIRLTKRGMSLMTMVITSSGLSRLATWFLSLVWMIPAVKRSVAWRLSGLGNYES